MGNGVDADATRDVLLATPNYRAYIVAEHGGHGMPPEARELRRITVGLRGVMLVGLTNLLATALPNVRERQREFDIINMLGMTPGQLVASVVTGADTLASPATLIGVPLGLHTSWLLFKLVGEGMLNAQPELYAAPGLGWLALLVLGVLLIAALASAVPARIAAQMQPAEALRYS